MTTDSSKLPLAVKYRPTSLRQVIGQPTAVESIQGFLASGRTLPYVIVLTGPFSSGKTTLARLIPLYANCEELTDQGSPCRRCPSCQGMRDVILGLGSHPDVVEVDGATKRGIDDVRNLQQLSELSPLTNYRFFIIDECHQLTPQAWQAILKTLEHPSGRSRFILCTTEPEKLPKTITSRGARRFNLAAIEPATTALLLRKVATKEGYKIPKSVRLKIAEAVDGHPRDALHLLEEVFDVIELKGVKALRTQFPTILEQSETYKAYKAAQDYITAIFAGDLKSAFLAINRADNLTSFVGQVISTFRLVLHTWVDKNLVDRTKWWMLKNVTYPKLTVGRRNMVLFGAVLANLVTAQEKIKTYLVDPHAILEATTIQNLELVQKATQEGK